MGPILWAPLSEQYGRKNPHRPSSRPRIAVNISYNPRDNRNRRTGEDTREKPENEKRSPRRRERTSQRKQTEHDECPETEIFAAVLFG